MALNNFQILPPTSYIYVGSRPFGFRWGFDALVEFDVRHGLSAYGMSGSDFDLIRAWCREQWGEESLDGVWVGRGTTIWVRDDNPAMEFKLRWC
ncbi:MAG: hypothetical protein EOP83_33180 [Verrucomicrobiaceae bacterium]|nr:MAG: hypothetical protein EOP83_33180 [Verrucomicrobiaceae bacterium]